MAEPLHGQLLSQARRLARLDPTRPRQGNVRRAVSTAYYGLFRFLIDGACRSIVGTAHDHLAKEKPSLLKELRATRDALLAECRRKE